MRGMIKISDLKIIKMMKNILGCKDMETLEMKRLKELKGIY